MEPQLALVRHKTGLIENFKTQVVERFVRVTPATVAGEVDYLSFGFAIRAMTTTCLYHQISGVQAVATH